MSQALYRKWRPARFDQIIGQEHVTHTLQNSIAGDRTGHAYLFCGPRGTGKTTMARLLAKAVNCEAEEPADRPDDTCGICLAINTGSFLDLIEIDAASNTGVDDIRSLREKINFAPSHGRYKVYIIDEVHMLSTAAFNALLKTLEEPPPHTIFVLATTEEHKVPLTIKSRCQQFNFRLLTMPEITGRLEFITGQESLEIEPAAVHLIARQASGSMRDAESLLDQLVLGPGETITLERAQMVLGTAPDESVSAVAEAWLNGDAAGGLDSIHEALDSGADARQFSRQMVAYLRQLLLLQAAGPSLEIDEQPERKAVMVEQAQRANRRALIEAVKRFHEASVQPSGNWQPQLPLELAFLQLLSEGEPVRRPPVETRTAAPQTIAPKAKPPSTERAKPAAREKAAAVADEKPAVAAPEETVAETAEIQPPPAASDEPLTVASVARLWHDLVNLVGKEQRNLPPLLAMCKPLAIEGNTVILGFDYPIFKEKYDKTEGAAQAVTAALRELTGTECLTRGVVSTEYRVPIQREEFHALADELGGVVREE